MLIASQRLQMLIYQILATTVYRTSKEGFFLVSVYIIYYRGLRVNISSPLAVAK